MEDIKKAIEELKTKAIRDQYGYYNYSSDPTYAYREGFESGLNKGTQIILSKWQDSERWRKVEEELPEIEKVWIKCTIHLPNNKTHVEYSSGVIYSKTDYKLDNKLVVSLITTSCKVEIEWKPIH